MGTKVGIYADEYQQASAKQLMNAVEEAEAHKIHLYLTAGDDGQKYASTLAEETGGQVVLLDPVTSGDMTKGAYFRAMEKNIRAVAEALEKGGLSK